MTVVFVLAAMLAASSWVIAGETGGLAGRVLPSTDGRLAARTVWVGSFPTPVAANGTFRATGLPGGPAELAIETSEGLYVVAAPIFIAPDTTRSVQLAMGGRQDSNAPPSSPEEKKTKRGGVWAHPIYATLIVVGSAVVVGFAVNDLTKSNTTNASPFEPAP